MEEKKPPSFLEKLKAKAEQQANYGGDMKEQNAVINAITCPNCGAGRTKQDGITHCAYCGFEFIATQLTDGLYINKKDNSAE